MPGSGSSSGSRASKASRAAARSQLPPTTRRGQSPARDADDDDWLTQLRPAWLAHEANWPAASARRKAAWKRLCSAAPFPWADPTSRVYASAAPEVCETFHEAREALDYSYHDRPLVARQRLQDDILLAALNERATPLPGERPWIVFTAGAMGVGKSHALLSLLPGAVDRQSGPRLVSSRPSAPAQEMDSAAYVYLFVTRWLCCSLLWF